MTTYFLSIKEAAKRLNICVSTAYSLAAPRGPIPCYRFGRTLRFDSADIEAYIQTCKVEPFNPVKEAGQARLTVVNLKASDPSGLIETFLKHGIEPKRFPPSKRTKPTKNK